jgi:hypothetical protein
MNSELSNSQQQLSPLQLFSRKLRKEVESPEAQQTRRQSARESRSCCLTTISFTIVAPPSNKILSLFKLIRLASLNLLLRRRLRLSSSFFAIPRQKVRHTLLLLLLLPRQQSVAIISRTTTP